MACLLQAWSNTLLQALLLCTTLGGGGAVQITWDICPGSGPNMAVLRAWTKMEAFLTCPLLLGHSFHLS